MQSVLQRVTHLVQGVQCHQLSDGVAVRHD